MRAQNLTLAVTLSLSLMPAMAAADTDTDTAAFDKAIQPIFTQYEKIQKSLAGDTTKGVAAAAKMIVKLSSKLDPRTIQGKHAAHYKGLPKKIKTTASRLSKAVEIRAQREAFMMLSRPLAMWAAMSRPAGINVVFCSMAKGSWLQRDKQIANPYYGAKMLRCGEVVSGKDKGTAGGHMKSGHGH